jgi:predicted transcriptional regulator of viral defense system
MYSAMSSIMESYIFVERVQALEAARRRIETLAEVRPGQYVIYNAETGERVFITAASFD